MDKTSQMPLFGFRVSRNDVTTRGSLRYDATPLSAGGFPQSAPAYGSNIGVKPSFL